MNKKKCDVCGKIWILEKFDQHPCVPLAKKGRASSKAKTAKPAGK
jgi:hypothetical protein